MRLSTSLRVFGQPPQPWQAQWRITAQDGAGEMILAPVDMDDQRNRVAWLRWCALADGAAAGAVLHDLFAQVKEKINQLVCGAQPQSWLWPYLQDNGFTQMDELITLQRDFDEPLQPPAASAITQRDATPADLSAISQLDALAFAPAWRYSRAALADGFAAGHILRVADGKGVVGYTLADLDGDHAHLVRIAVLPSSQRGGVGKLLLADGLAAAQTLGATTYTLNVQKSNPAAQHLYDSFGFRRIGKPLKIMGKFFDGRRKTEDGR